MELIERYLHAVGRYLPGTKREDILSEMRSTLEDQIEAAAAGEPTEVDAAAAIKAMGPPRAVAAAYYPAGQYLVGPELYPLYSMILGIVLAAAIGGQLIALAVSVVVAGSDGNYLGTFWGILESLPAAFGWVTLSFFILQRLEVKPDRPAEEFDPYDLPPVVASEQVKRSEHAAGILAGVVALAVFSWFFSPSGAGQSFLAGVFEDPILMRYFPWIAASIFAGIVVDILLLWRGAWNTGTRLVRLVVNLFSLGVLSVLIQAHADWLRGAGINPSIAALGEAANAAPENLALLIMLGIWIGLVVAAVTTLVQTVMTGIRTVRGLTRQAA